MTKIFISHSNNDSEFALRLAHALIDKGIDVWIDKSDIRAGMKWNMEIQHGLNECDTMIVILSPESMTSNNVGDEWLYYHTRKKRIFTVLWKPTKVHFQLEPIQYVDFHTLEFTTAFAHLSDQLWKQGFLSSDSQGQMHEIRTVQEPPVLISTRIQEEMQSSMSVDSILPPPFEWIEIPGGVVKINKGGKTEIGNGNYTSHTVNGTAGGVYQVPTFKIAKYPVTEAQFQTFLAAPDGYDDPNWWNYSGHAATYHQSNDMSHQDIKNYPVSDRPLSYITWYDAVAFSIWLTAKVLPNVEKNTEILQITLPSEQQWQRAAIGDTDWKFPWGNQFDSAKCNTGESGFKSPTPVTRYLRGASPYGVMDMSGNVWEWCLNNWETDDIDIGHSAYYRSIRGGSYNGYPRNAEAKRRDFESLIRSRYANWGLGFRLVLVTSINKLESLSTLTQLRDLVSNLGRAFNS